jgi:cellulose synthase/poly-beta-1,6-N-acetylglucosamine synthase-like glycosyltransferase
MTIMEIVSPIALVLFVASATLAIYSLIGYPLLTFLLAWFAPRKIAKAPIEPKVSFIISAYNEEKSIDRKIRETLQLDYPREQLEIIVASDGSSDRTDEIVRTYAGRGVRLLRTEGRVGKTATLDAAIEASAGEIIICSDATSVYDPQSVRALTANFADPTVGGVDGRVVYKYDGSLTSKGFKLYQTFIVRQRLNESRFGHQVQLSGAIQAIRRQCHRTCPPELSSEEWNAMQIAMQGRRTVYETRATALEESRSRMGSEFRARIRMAIQCYAFTHYAIVHAVRPGSLVYAFQILSSKIIRWYLPFILLIMLATSTVLGGVSSVWLTASLLMWSCTILALATIVLPRLTARIPGLPLLSFFTVVMFAFAAGWFIFCRGGRAASWEPERGK